MFPWLRRADGGEGGALPGPRCVAIRVATLARHEIVVRGFENLPRRYGSGEGTPRHPSLPGVASRASLLGPVSSGEILDAQNQNLVAG